MEGTSISFGISVRYPDVKEFFEDVRNFFKKRKLRSSDNPDKCDKCREFKFCGTGFGFLVNIGGLDKHKIRKVKEEEGIMTLDLRKISKDAKNFLSEESFGDFHDTLHDYAESTNYVGVLNHILSHMSLFDLWLSEVQVLSDDCKNSAKALLRQLIDYLPAIYITKKDPYEGSFRKTKLARQFFTKEAKDLLEEAVNLLQVNSKSKFKKNLEKITNDLTDLRNILTEEYRTALKAALITGEELRKIFRRKD